MKKIMMSFFCALFLMACKGQTSEVIQPIKANELAQLDTKNIQLLDVRTSKEFADGHIDGAKNIDFFADSFTDEVLQNFDKNQPIYLYCRSGNRSAKAAKLLEKNGFIAIFEYQGGYIDWEKNTKAQD